jgi:hypothetical protein
MRGPGVGRRLREATLHGRGAARPSHAGAAPPPPPPPPAAARALIGGGGRWLPAAAVLGLFFILLSPF